MSSSIAQGSQNGFLALSRSVLALKTALWPESGLNLTQSGHKFLYGWVNDNNPIKFKANIFATMKKSGMKGMFIMHGDNDQS